MNPNQNLHHRALGIEQRLEALLDDILHLDLVIDHGFDREQPASNHVDDPGPDRQRVTERPLDGEVLQDQLEGRDPHLGSRSELDSVSGGVNGPPGGAKDGVLQVRPDGAKWSQGPLLFGSLGALEPVMETARPPGPCTFRQEAVENEEAVGLGSTGPLHQSIHRPAPDGAGPSGRHTPLTLVGSEARSVLRRVDLGVGALDLHTTQWKNAEPA